MSDTTIKTREEQAQELVYRGIIYDALSGVLADLREMKTQSTAVPTAYKEGWNESLEVAILKIKIQAETIYG